MSQNAKHIASCSGGIDSVATILLAYENGEPLDGVVCCEVMFDKDISGEVPEHRDFIYSTLKPFVENVVGVPLSILQSNKTYTDVFLHTITRGPNLGKTHGFVYPGMCAINRDCKIPPIRQFWKDMSGPVIQYVGIESDETERLLRLNGTNMVSLLEKYDMTKKDAGKLCAKYGMVSPSYDFTDRNGCWFCPNCKDSEWAHLIFNHEWLFDRLIALETSHPDRSRRCLTINETATELKCRIKRQGCQCSLFEKME